MHNAMILNIEIFSTSVSKYFSTPVTKEILVVLELVCQCTVGTYLLDHKITSENLKLLLTNTNNRILLSHSIPRG